MRLGGLGVGIYTHIYRGSRCHHQKEWFLLDDDKAVLKQRLNLINHPTKNGGHQDFQGNICVLLNCILRKIISIFITQPMDPEKKV